jgi:hypothetical protein
VNAVYGNLLIIKEHMPRGYKKFLNWKKQYLKFHNLQSLMNITETSQDNLHLPSLALHKISLKFEMMRYICWLIWHAVTFHCHSLGSQLLDFHSTGLGLQPGQSMWDLWWKK